MDNQNLITLAHGSGGRLYHQLVEQVFLPAFDNPLLRQLKDSAVCDAFGGKIAMTTDSFVVKPRFFPGGDIGRLAVCGTVNDLAMSGARPYYLTLAMIIEAGLPIDELSEICASIAAAAAEAGVVIVSGDTKVVEKGNVDGIYINTSGVGFFPDNRKPLSGTIQAGDKIIVSGELAAHGMAVLAARENLGFDPPILSDVAPLNNLAEVLLAAVPEVHALRDPTRGGAAMTLNEWALDSGLTVYLFEEDLPVDHSAAIACDILGLEPLNVANEGKFLAAVPECFAEQAVAALRSHSLGEKAKIIGEVQVDDGGAKVCLHTLYGGRRIIDMPEGEQLPRIC